ncbi:molecular chaperone TorD family protein [Adlercreutzia sp. R25]|uniref:Molecular chaperone TorD family protein n=1 Tax=Adlercreutzia shanghongiae TaxID=3111773 RepID=A0ABU6IYB2_9ACTN|nr:MULTISPECIES: molecular chaperone TorD family protein [unclassified Adlercreutzia]MEC4271833.1 molecular chaperone TorD family protein [Adlercreutzia sp. R25]MEC4294840.1 molecular chaperone TorD family protein [Adlercreutzia sp. R22]
MTDAVNLRRESIDLEALLLCREYLYALFHKLFGGTPDEAMLALALSETTRDVVEEFSGEDPSMRGLGRFLQDLGECVDQSVLLDQARDEYTRLFIGPGELPCQPIESPYLTHDAALFQENTLAVRALYRERGLELKRLMRVPDDHIATMCGFMAHEAGSALTELRAGHTEALAASLRDQEAFVRGHMLSWVDDFARCARRSKTAVLYPQMIEALAAFVRNDAVLLSESAFWAEEAIAANGEVVPGGLGAMPGSPETAVFAEVSEAITVLNRVCPFGIEDHELVAAKA